MVRLLERSPGFVRGRHLVPHFASHRTQFRITLDGVPDLEIESGLAEHQPVVAQTNQLAGCGFVVFQKLSQQRLRQPPIVLALRRKSGQLLNARPQAREGGWQGGIAVKTELGGRSLAHRDGGIASRKHQVAVLHSAGRPLEIVRRNGRLAVFVNTEERDVQAVPQIGDAISFPAEEGERIFGSKHEPNVRVLLVPI